MAIVKDLFTSLMKVADNGEDITIPASGGMWVIRLSMFNEYVLTAVGEPKESDVIPFDLTIESILDLVENPYIDGIPLNDIAHTYLLAYANVRCKEETR